MDLALAREVCDDAAELGKSAFEVGIPDEQGIEQLGTNVWCQREYEDRTLIESHRVFFNERGIVGAAASRWLRRCYLMQV